jgi:hypothetical protein
MMAVMTRDSWTDERLDDLNGKVDRLDKRMETGFGETRDEFRAFRSETSNRLDGLRNENAAQMRLMLQLFATMMVGILGAIATIIVK